MGSQSRGREQYDSSRGQQTDYSNYNYEQEPYPAHEQRSSRNDPSNDYRSEEPDSRRNSQQLQRTRDSHRRSKYSESSSDDSSSDSEDDRRQKHRSSRSNNNQKSNCNERDRSQSPLRQAFDKGKEHFSVSNKGAAATLVGAIAGGLIGQEATKEKNKKRGSSNKNIGATIAGAVIGGLGANALEKKYDDRERDERRRRQRSR